MAGTLLLIVVLVLLAMVLIVVDICTPTFGLLALLVLGCLGWAVYMAWGIGQVFGLALLLCLIVFMPIYIVALVKILPKTSLGRLMYLSRDAVAPGEGTPEGDQLAALVGRKAQAECNLRPAGTIRIDGQRIIAQAESGMIDKGRTVVIVQAAGNRVVVRAVEE